MPLPKKISLFRIAKIAALFCSSFTVATTLFAVPTLSAQAQSVVPSFSVDATPPGTALGVGGYSVSCPTWDFCMAVGNTGTGYISPDAMQWNGTEVHGYRFQEFNRGPHTLSGR